MKLMSNFLVAAGLLLAPAAAFAQVNLKLTCPLEHSNGREPKEAYSWEPKDLRVIMVSSADSIVRSCYEARVSNLNPTEDGLYEMVIYYKNYYFWYSGIAGPIVKVGSKVTAGQALGTYKPGTELEFRMFKDEDPVDPRNLLECKIARAD